jgi:porphobilinogen synthase
MPRTRPDAAIRPSFPVQRPRRLRIDPILRDMVAETTLRPSDFVLPLFVRPGKNVRRPVASMPGVDQVSPDTAVKDLKAAAAAGVRSYLLFGVLDKKDKDPRGDCGHDPDGPVCQTLRRAKDAGIEMPAITDLCYCEYTSHGHCGILTDTAETVDNDATIVRLGEQAVVHARAGADVIAPSAMMDGQVGAIRAALDAAGFRNTPILSYAVKYASGLYGPFRDAAESPPAFGDRRAYQMDFRGSREAVREAAADVAQGADIVMVKPGTLYLDVIRQVREAVDVPVAAYHVSGEYAMLKAAAANGWIDEDRVLLETMHAFKRAGASMVLTYYARKLAEMLG